MNAIVPINPSQAPALARQQFAEKSKTLSNNFAQGVLDSFPVISIKGKIFRFKFQGEEHPHIDANRYPIPYLDIVLVNGSPDISKVFYEKGFTEGDMNPPDCSSLNGIKPDPASPKLQSATCGGCKQNVFGSRITPAGKKAKACADSRRVAVAVPNDLGVKDVMPIMLRVPQSSTKGLKEYVLYLERNGFLPNACVTRLSFDPNDAFPKLQYNFAGPLTDVQYQHADALVADERTLRILAAPIDSGDVEVNEPGSLQTSRVDPVTPAQYAMVGAAQVQGQPQAEVQTAAAVTQGVTEDPAFQAFKAQQEARLNEVLDSPAYAAWKAQQAAIAAEARRIQQENAERVDGAHLAVPIEDPAFTAWKASQAAKASEEEAARQAAVKAAAKALLDDHNAKLDAERKAAVVQPTEDPAFTAWKASQAAQQAAPAASPGPAGNGAAASPFGGLTAVQTAPAPGPTWTGASMPEGTPAFLMGDKSVNGPVIDGTVNPAPEATAKKRTRPSAPPAAANPANDGPAAVGGAPAGLDDLLAGLLAK